MVDVFKRNFKVGIGGYRCRCCGPAQKDRPKARRIARHRCQQDARFEIEEQIADAEDLDVDPYDSSPNDLFDMEHDYDDFLDDYDPDEGLDDYDSTHYADEDEDDDGPTFYYDGDCDCDYEYEHGNEDIGLE